MDKTERKQNAGPAVRFLPGQLASEADHVSPPVSVALVMEPEVLADEAAAVQSTFTGVVPGCEGGAAEKSPDLAAEDHSAKARRRRSAPARTGTSAVGSLNKLRASNAMLQGFGGLKPLEEGAGQVGPHPAGGGRYSAKVTLSAEGSGSGSTDRVVTLLEDLHAGQGQLLQGQELMDERLRSLEELLCSDTRSKKVSTWKPRTSSASPSSYALASPRKLSVISAQSAFSSVAMIGSDNLERVKADIQGLAPIEQEGYGDEDQESCDSEPDVEWPMTVECRYNLCHNQTYHPRRKSTGKDSVASANVSVGSLSNDEDSLDQRYDQPPEVERFYTLDPNSKPRAFIDVISLIVSMHDMLVIPWMVAWDIDLHTGIRETLLVSTMFWTIDIGLSFFTGFYIDGMIERRMGLVAKRYLKSWFILDFTLVVFDWISTIAVALDIRTSSGASSIKVFRSIKVAKFLRILGLLRMVRLSHVFEEYLNRTLAGGFLAVLHVIKLLCMVLWLSHLNTCLWFVLGNVSTGDTGQSWFDTVAFTQGFEHAPVTYQYVTSFHFALSQITANGVEMLSPLNSIERGFNIVCLIFGLFFSSHVVSTFSSAMLQLEMVNQQKNKTLRQLSQLLDQHRVRTELCIRVTRQIKERMSSTKMLTEEDVPALELLSHSLLRELRYALHGAHLETHPLMRLLRQLQPLGVADVCSAALHVLVVPAGDALFHAGKEAQYAYILGSGDMAYTLRDDGRFVVSQDQWLSEAALWCIWNHVGECVASSACQVLCLHPDHMIDALFKYEGLHSMVSAYGRRFHSHLVAASPPSAPYPDDLQVAYTSYSDIVMGLGQKEQQVIADVALRYLLRSRLWGMTVHVTPEILARLRREVSEGKSFVLQDQDGSASRVVHVSLLKLKVRDEPACFLAEIGRIEKDGTVKMDFQLPGGKQRRGELPSHALRRAIFQAMLKDIVSHIEIESVTRETVWKESERYALQTKYTKTLHHATLNSKCDLASTYEVIQSPFHEIRASRPARPSGPATRPSGAGGLQMSRTANLFEMAAHMSRNRSDQPSTAVVHFDDVDLDNLYGLDRVAYNVGGHLLMVLDSEHYDFLESGNGNDLLEAYGHFLQQQRNSG
eukprot:TRINITY_DN15937_c0_g1_i1.p1 TRINITY_DN15937_c0_g1~~TRINITY_DN15937_c0_g1_i1.p1  ORF type:complete len:1114 (+),score=190.29 TRINITY_DN15937_c0_g1_i1:122-3463(+)